MTQIADASAMSILVIIFLLVVGPLAVLYGADSRLDDHR
jgi:hypothetical protein